MFTQRMLALLAGALLAGAAVAQDLNLDQILDKNLEALGGGEALKAVQTITMSAKMVMGGVMEAPMVMQVKRPGKVRTEITIQGRKIVTAFDGTDGWMINPMQGPEPQKLPERLLKSAAQNADMESSVGALKAVRDAGHTVELVGKEDVEGSPAYRIKVTRKNGDVQTYFLDADKFLPIKVVFKTTQMGQEMEVESFPGNYKKVAGVVMAHAMDQKAGGRSIVQMTIEKIEVNLPMDDEIFKMPVVEKAAEKPAEKAAEKPAEKAAEKPAEKKP